MRRCALVTYWLVTFALASVTAAQTWTERRVRNPPSIPIAKARTGPNAKSFTTRTTLTQLEYTTPHEGLQCFDDAIPLANVDKTFNVTSLVSGWDSNLLANSLVAIVLRERIGVSVRHVNTDTLYAWLLETVGIDYDTDQYSSRNLIAQGYADYDIENWNEYAGVTPRPVEGVMEGLLGYVGEIGWFVPSYVVQADPDLKSYISLKYNKAKVFNPDVVPTIDDIQRPPAALDIVASRASLPLCTSSSPSYNITACLLGALQTQSGNEIRGVIYAPNQLSWGAKEAVIIATLGLNLDIHEVNPPGIDRKLTMSLIEANRRRQPWLGYLYTPNAIFSPFSGVNLSQVSLPQWTPACDAELSANGTYPCGYGTTFVKRFVSTRLQTQSNPTYDFLTKFRIDLEDMNYMMGHLTFRNHTVFESSCAWLKANRDKWESLVPTWYRTRPVCPAGFMPAQRSQHNWECVKCPPGTFNLISDGRCLPCPVGANCPGGSQLLADKGFWFDDTSRPTSPGFYKCPHGPSCCPDGMCARNATCVEGRTGVMCGACAMPGYYQWNDVCVDCSNPSNQGAGLLSVPFICLLIVVAVFLVICSTRESVFLSDLLLFYQLTSFILARDDTSQIIILKVATFNIGSLFDGALPQNLCVLPLSNLDRIIGKALLPFGLWLVLAFYHIMAISLWKLRSRLSLVDWMVARLPEDFRTAPSLWQFFFTRYCVLFTLTCMPLVDGALSLISCRTIGIRGRFLVQAPDVECFVGAHIPAFIYGVTILTLCVGVIPLLTLCIILKIIRKNKLNDQNTRIKYGIFYTHYRPKFAWYGFADMMKRGVAVIACTVIRRDTDAEYLLNLMVVATLLFLYIIEHWNARPLRSRFENHFRFISYISAFALCMASTLKLSESHSEFAFMNTGRLIFLGIFLFFPCILIPWYVIYVILKLRKQALAGPLGRNQLGTSSTLASRLRLKHIREHQALKLLNMYRVMGSETDFETSTDTFTKALQTGLEPSSTASEFSVVTSPAFASMARKVEPHSHGANGKRAGVCAVRTVVVQQSGHQPTSMGEEMSAQRDNTAISKDNLSDNCSAKIIR